MKQRFASRDAYLESWLRSHLGFNIISEDGVLAEDHELRKAAKRFIARERERSRKSLGFRLRRQQEQRLRSKLSKNKNRQVAARQRVRDENGKFQGGVRFRRAKILFLIEKVKPQAAPHSASAPVNFDSRPSTSLQADLTIGNRDLEKLVESAYAQDAQRGRLLLTQQPRQFSKSVGVAHVESHHDYTLFSED